jgi:hypothetical protein
MEDSTHWLTTITAAGVVGSLLFTGINTLFTAAYFHADAKHRHVSNLIALDERHRAFWSEVKQRPELQRILSKTVDLEARPLTLEEDVSMWQIIQQFESGWEVFSIMNRRKLECLARDAAAIFSLPLPRFVWEKEKQYHQPEFVRFVLRALDRYGRLTVTGA